jgi:hypothetical protein
MLNFLVKSALENHLISDVIKLIQYDYLLNDRENDIKLINKYEILY